jgi:hypothetical protein
MAQDNLAAFHLLLAFASADRSILQGQDEPVQAIEHSSQSLQVLRNRLSQPSHATSDGTILAVALQILYQVSVLPPETGISTGLTRDSFFMWVLIVWRHS